MEFFRDVEDSHRDEVSALQRPASRSSTSSDILVAPGLPLSPTTSGQHFVDESSLQVPLEDEMSEQQATAEVHGGRLFVVKATSRKARRVLENLNRQDGGNSDSPRLEDHSFAGIKNEVNDDQGDGPNHRGTYSKQYVLQHPEIEWVHRGQGRYLPATHSQSHSKMKHSRRTNGFPSSSGHSLRKVADDLRTTTTSSLPSRRRSLDDDRKTSIFATPKQRLSLRRQYSEAQAVSTTEQRSARSSRRVKAVPTTELERRSSRLSTQQNYNEDEEYDSMAEGKGTTYTREYVEAHPNEKFYHTGNGWYKRGQRPKGHQTVKKRESEGHAGVRRSDGSFSFERKQTIHVSQLDKYPGVEFHHCGNGWYKPGPDATGHRTSLVVDEDDESEDDEDGVEDEDGGLTVGKGYALAHPEAKWSHRGDGRNKRHSAVSAPTTYASTSISPGAERDQSIYSKEYVEAHPEEEFHHRGNARYMRGPAPEHWAASRRKRSSNIDTAPEDSDAQLFNKAYVRAHPNEVFHHRGQGRWARGSRPKLFIQEESEEEEFEGDLDGLVDTDYVDAHPNETFHHRGQGRWARGLPPPGSSNKVAVRGPASRDRSDAAALIEEEDQTNKPPPLNALVLKGEGPDTWPGLSWHYRGGGKWCRLTKQEAEDFHQRGTRKRSNGRTKSVSGPEAQLEREFAAAEAAHHIVDDGGFHDISEVDDDGRALQEKPKMKRRRLNKRGSFQVQDGNLNSKHSSNVQSQAPTPKPRMLEPDEDILGEEDMPQLYQDDDWSPDPDDVEQYPDHRLDNLFRPIKSAEPFVQALAKYDPATRPLDNLKLLADNTQLALDQLQEEYLFLDRVSAPHQKARRNAFQGGRLPVDHEMFEDKKEADLYDYTYDPRRSGYQDPLGQKIQRDADGRELRLRRQRNAAQAHSGTLPGWNFGEDEPLGPRRAVKPVHRFDGVVDQPRKRIRNSANATGFTSKAPSETPDRLTTPFGGPAPNGYMPATSGRWRGHVPKRIRELRGDSAGPPGVSRELDSGDAGRKGRPPGSRNLHRRSDAGIKKGPRRVRGNGEREASVGSDEGGYD